MNKYRIKVSYFTGDSFGSEDAEEYVELEWTNLDIAKENLKAIQEHYKYYQDIRKYKPEKTRKEWSVLLQDTWWYVPDYDFCMKLKTDKNTFMQQSNFWCGTFEGLYGAEIEPIPDPDLKFTLR